MALWTILLLAWLVGLPAGLLLASALGVVIGSRKRKPAAAAYEREEVPECAGPGSGGRKFPPLRPVA
jgi:hypothetical protein